MPPTKIYTKTGDKGSTLLATGERVPKSNLRIEAYGTVDELNAWIGKLRDSLESAPHAGQQLAEALLRIQHELFQLGAELATAPTRWDVSGALALNLPDVERLEHEMDAANISLSPLANFILPGGHPSNSTAHLARTVCRRAERCVVRLREADPDVRLLPQIYLNRLSDWLFIGSRQISSVFDVPEVLWQPKGKKP